MKMNIGELQIITLEKEGVGGYTWQCQNNNIVGLKIEQLATVVATPGNPGAPASARFKITALSKGSFHLHFILKRNWEVGSNQKPVAEKAISVEVN